MACAITAGSAGHQHRGGSGCSAPRHVRCRRFFRALSQGKTAEHTFPFRPRQEQWRCTRRSYTGNLCLSQEIVMENKRMDVPPTRVRSGARDKIFSSCIARYPVEDARRSPADCHSIRFEPHEKSETFLGLRRFPKDPHRQVRRSGRVHECPAHAAGREDRMSGARRAISMCSPAFTRGTFRHVFPCRTRGVGSGKVRTGR